MLKRFRRQGRALAACVAMLLAVACLTLAPVTMTGCKPNPSQQSTLYKVGLGSKGLAETAYQTLYRARKAGKVEDGMWRQSQLAYDAWAAAQGTYVTAVTMGVGDKAAAERAVRQALAKFLNLAAALSEIDPSPPPAAPL